MNRSIWSYFQIAGMTATSKDDLRSFLLGAVGLRDDGVMVKALNSSSSGKTPRVHAENRLSSKLDYGATVYVARIKLCDGSFAIARPCHHCMQALRSRFVKKIYYTINNDEYGVIDLKYGKVIGESKRTKTASLEK